MISKLFTYAILPLLCFTSISCQDDFNFPSEEDTTVNSSGNIIIRFKNTNNLNKSEEESSIDNENLITNLYIGLYGLTDDENTLATVWYEVVTSANTNGQYIFSTPLKDGIVRTLFNDGTDQAKCRLVVLANVTGLTSKSRLSMKGMKEYAIEATFSAKTTETNPSSFVMEGEGEIKYSKLSDSVFGEISLIRAASKINFSIDLPDKMEVKGETWIPVTDETSNPIRTLLYNGVDKAIACPVGINGTPWSPTPSGSFDPYFTSDQPDTYRKMIQVSSEDENDSPGNPDSDEDNEQESIQYSKYEMESVYYTFPNAWKESFQESNKTSLTLMVPWQQLDDSGNPQGDIRWYYYQVPIAPAGINYITRNTFYNIHLKVGMLGSMRPEAPLRVENASYTIVDWEEEELNVPIQDTRYLVVSPTEYTMNNEEEIQIPFYTSHPVKISNITMSYKRFNFYNDGEGDVVDLTISKEVLDNSVMVSEVNRTQLRDSLCAYSIEYSEVTKQLMLRIKHPLKIWIPLNASGNEVSLTGKKRSTSVTEVIDSIVKYTRPTAPESSYSPYKIAVTLQHKDDESMSQEIVINQYPGMYIEVRPNPGERYNYDKINKTENGVSEIYPDNDMPLGYAFVNAVYYYVPDGKPEPFGYWANNNYPGLDKTASSLGSINGIRNNAGNQNPNMYIINISSLDADSPYIIGDPRSQYICNNLSGTGRLNITANETSEAGTWCYEARALFDGKLNDPNKGYRRLKYYYPTRETAPTAKETYMVAPRFRVASSYGRCANKTFNNREAARRRAATYQELDCPAGRWRVPTMGEVLFIMTLSSKKIIPYLFQRTNYYVTAQGFIMVGDNGKVTTLESTSAFAGIRAVYDEWYWSEKTDYVLEKEDDGSYWYTLGDIPRTSKDPTPPNN